MILRGVKFPAVSNFTESIIKICGESSLPYDLRRVKFSAVSYCAESVWGFLSSFIAKRSQLGPPIQSWRQIDKIHYTGHKAIFQASWNKGTVWYCAKLDSPQYHTARSKKNPQKLDSAQSQAMQFEGKALSSMKLHKIWHCPVSYSSSAQYDTAGSLTLCSIILCGVTLYCAESTATS